MPVDAREVRYIVFGWGGRAFYLETPTWSELKAAPVLKAVTDELGSEGTGKSGSSSGR